MILDVSLGSFPMLMSQGLMNTILNSWNSQHFQTFKNFCKKKIAIYQFYLLKDNSLGMCYIKRRFNALVHKYIQNNGYEIEW